MEKIKDFIIHLFGGMTRKESKESNYNSFEIGKFSAFCQAKRFGDDNNINNPLYDYICQKLDSVGNNNI